MASLLKTPDAGSRPAPSPWNVQEQWRDAALSPGPELGPITVADLAALMAARPLPADRAQPLTK